MRPHAFVPCDDSQYAMCDVCGGGRLHKIHHVDLPDERAETQMVEYAVRMRQERDKALDALRAALPIVLYVSHGRGFIGVEPYPDAAARAVGAQIMEMVS